MRVTEQVDAMEVSGTNPFKYLVVTRVVATTLMVPILGCYFAFVGLFGAYLNVHSNEQTSYIAFIDGAFSQLSFVDLLGSMLKATIFGFTIGITGCYKGYSASHGTVGVGRAANAAVVTSMFLIFIEEMILVQIINYFR
jgi:phospholipid/cholesterol/gamma-HCH transport system permease protein